MTYDHWKTTDDTPEDDLGCVPIEEDELDLVYGRLDVCIESAKLLRDSYDELLAASKLALIGMTAHIDTPVGDPTFLRLHAATLAAAIAAAEERAQ